MLTLSYALIVSFALANILGQVDGVHAIALLITSATSIDPSPHPVHINPALIPSSLSIDSPTSTGFTSSEISHNSNAANSDDRFAPSALGASIITQSSQPSQSLTSASAAEKNGASASKDVDPAAGSNAMESPGGAMPAKVQHMSTVKFVLLFVFMTVVFTLICFAQRKSSCSWSAVSLPRALSSRSSRETASGRTTAIVMRNMPPPDGTGVRRRPTNENIDPDSVDALPQYARSDPLSLIADASGRVLSSIISSATDINRAVPDPETAPPAYNRPSPPSYSPSPLGQVHVGDDSTVDDEVTEDYVSDTSESDTGEVAPDSLNESKASESDILDTTLDSPNEPYAEHLQ